jgi:hypothetical protein
MDQYKREIVTHIKGCKRSPASPASPAPHACLRSDGRASKVASNLLQRLKANTPPTLPGTQVLSCYLEPAKTHHAHPVILGRVQRLFDAARRLLDQEITTAWLARTLVRVDHGPLLDAPRLGPALRVLGFKPLRRRQGTHRCSVWLVPGAARPRVGRPRARPVGAGDQAVE